MDSTKGLTPDKAKRRPEGNSTSKKEPQPLNKGKSNASYKKR